MSDAVGQFIGLVALVFPKPKFEAEGDEALWTAMLVRQLGCYAPAVLSRAADTITSTRTKKDGAFFPLPAECVAACEKAKRQIECQKVPLLAGAKAPPMFSRERHKLALDLLRTGMGTRALAEGWHLALYDFVYANARLPSESECGALKALVAEVSELIEACDSGRIEGGPGLDVRRLAELGRNVTGRKDKVARALSTEDAA